MIEEEVWKPIENFDGYEVSNLGRVKSLSRLMYNNTGSYISKEKILKPSITNQYLRLNLSKNNKRTNFTIHSLVAIAFLEHKPNGSKYVVNHKDFNKLNNHVNNLEIVTTRENTNLKHLQSTSIYTGVSWKKLNKKWCAQITIDGKVIYLGLYTEELEASKVYEKKLSEILKNTSNVII